jgi:hypothetical protein
MDGATGEAEGVALSVTFDPTHVGVAFQLGADLPYDIQPSCVEGEMTKALMLVPAASNHAGGFLATALDLRDTVYGRKNAMIFKMAMADREGKSWRYLPAVTPPAGFSRDFDESLDVAETFMIISHIGRIDGPDHDARSNDSALAH